MLTETVQSVTDWRIDVLRLAGYDEFDARALALSDADLHLAVTLIKAGCPPVTALRILL
jgi:hypothetical protein